MTYQDYQNAVDEFHQSTLNGFSVKSRLCRLQLMAELIQTPLVPERSGDSLLDYGCNDGMFWGIHGFMFKERYTGVDRNPTMIEHAKKTSIEHGKNMRPGNFILGDVLDNPEVIKPHDLVVASGVLCYQHPTAKLAHQLIVQRLWERTKKILVFNMLTTENPKAPSHHTCYHPADAVTMVLHLGCRRFRLLHDYLPNDFTVVMYR